MTKIEMCEMEICTEIRDAINILEKNAIDVVGKSDGKKYYAFSEDDYKGILECLHQADNYAQEL